MLLKIKFYLALIIMVFFVFPVFSQSPTIESIMPNWGPPSGGTNFVIKGTNFNSGITVYINEIECSTTLVDSETLNATSPDMGTFGIYQVKVENTDETFAIRDYGFNAIETVYYISISDGDDSLNDGLTPSTPKKSIQKTIDQLIGNFPVGPQEMRLEQGTYKENLWLRSKMVLTGGWSTGFTERDPDQYITILDGDYDDLCARSWGEGAIITVDGITMVNGRRVGGGGGFKSFDDYSTLTNNIIISNRSEAQGPGAYFLFTKYNYNSTISNNIIIGNSTNYWGGGAVFITSSETYLWDLTVDISISNNYIVGNNSNRGSGLWIYPTYNESTKVQIKNNIIAKNEAMCGKGAGILISNDSTINIEADIKNNLIRDNDSCTYGGGLTIDGAGDGTYTITQNTITGNRANWLGDGLLVHNSNIATVDVRNSILYFNNGDDIHDGPNTTSVTYSDIEEGFAGTGNISIDPLFVDGPLGSQYLSQTSTGDPDETANSPCLDSGSGTASESVMDSLVTRTDDVADSGTVDMGYHYNVSGLPDEGPYPPPVVASIIPSGGHFRGGDWVVIRGSGYLEGTKVFFDSEESEDVMVITGKKLIAEVPVSVGEVRGYVDLEVRNPDAQSDTVVNGYRYMDMIPPMWDSTVGVQLAYTPNDCTRAAVLKWNSASDADSPPVTYNIYRTQDDPIDVTPFIPTKKEYPSDTQHYRDATFINNVSDLVYTDDDVGPKTYWYIVQAVDSENPENRELNGIISYGVDVAMDSKDTTPPLPVGNTLLVTTPDQGTTIHLDWMASEGAFKYHIYRSIEASAIYYVGKGSDGLPGVAGVDDDNDRYGEDGQPGVAGVDDDMDGTIDEDDEWCPGGEEYGDDDCSGKGSDGQPGVAGVDDDMDGTIDENDEWCPGGAPYGDDDCSQIDDCDEWCPGHVPYGDDECGKGLDGQPGVAGVDDDNDRYGLDGGPGVAGVDDDADGTFDEEDEWCPGGEAYGDDCCGCIDEADEWCPLGIPYGDDACISSLLYTVEHGYTTEWDDTNPAGDILFYRIKATDSCSVSCYPSGNVADE